MWGNIQSAVTFFNRTGRKNLRLCLVRLKVIAKRPFAYSQKLSVDLSVTHNIKKIVNKINNEKWQKMLI